MAVDFGTIHFSRRMMMRWAYRYARDAGLPRYQALIVATKSARPMTVDAMIGRSLAKSMLTTGPSAPYDPDAGE